MTDLKGETWFNIVLLERGDLHERTKSALLAAGITTLGEAMSLGERELLRIPNFGRKSLNEINHLADVFDGPSTTRRAAARSALRHIGDRIEQLELQLASAQRSLERERAIVAFGLESRS